MSTEIDQRIVEMRFDNKQFEKNAQQTLNTLEKLNDKLNFEDCSKSLDKLGKASKNFTLDDIGNAVDSLSKRFSTMGIIGMSALDSITKSALSLGKKLYKTITGPLIEGGKNRALNIEQAKFQLKGLGIAWSSIEDDINYGVKDTAYGLDSAAKVAAQLSASGIQIGDNMKTALRGISGVATMTNSTYDDIGRIYTAVAGNGRLMGEQLLSLSGRGLNAAAALAKYLGKSEAEVRDMVSKGKIDFQTFADAMDSTFGEHAKAANETFTGALSNMKAALSRIGADVATPALEDLKDIFNAIRPVINKVHTELKPFISDLTTVMKVVTNGIVKMFNNFDVSWVAPAFKTISNVFKQVAVAIAAVSTAYKEVFPNSSGHIILDVIRNIKNLSYNLGVTEETFMAIKNVSKGVFSMLRLAGVIVGNVLKAVSPLIKPVNVLLNMVLILAGYVGDLVYQLNTWIEKTQILQTVIKVLGAILVGVPAILVYIISKVGQLIKKVSQLSVVQTVFNGILTVLKTIKNIAVSGLAVILYAIVKIVSTLYNLGKVVIPKILSIIQNGFKKIVTWLGNTKKTVEKFFNSFASAKTIGDKLKVIGDQFIILKNSIIKGLLHNPITDFFKKISESAKDSNTNIGKLVLTFKKLASEITPGRVALVLVSVAVAAFARSVYQLSKSLTTTSDSIGGFFKSLKKVVDGKTAVKKAHSVFLEFATSIAILAGSLFLLTKIVNDAGFNKSLIVLGGMIAVMTLAGSIITVVNKKAKDATQAAVNIVALAASTLILIGSLKALEHIDFTDIWLKVLVLGSVLAEIAATAVVVSRMSGGSVRSSLMLLSFALAAKGIIKALVSIKDVDLSGIHDSLGDLIVVMMALSVMAASLKHVGLGSFLTLFLIISAIKQSSTSLSDLVNAIDYDKILGSLDKYRETIASIGIIATAMMFAFGRADKSFKAVTTGLMKMAVAIVVLALVMKLLETIKNKEVFTRSAIAIGGAMALLVAFTGLSKLTEKVNLKDLNKSILSIATLIVVLAGAMKLLQGVTFDFALVGKMALMTGTIIVAMLAAYGVAKNLDSTQATTFKSLAALFASMALIFAELIAIAFIPVAQLEQAVTVMSIMAVVLGAVGYALTKTQNCLYYKKNIITMIALAVMLVELAAILHMFGSQNYDWVSVVAATGGMVVVMIMIGRLLRTISKSSGLKDTKASVIYGAAAIIAAIGFALGVTCQYEWYQFIAPLVAIGACFAAMFGLLKVISKSSGLKDTKATVLYGIAAMIAAIGVSLSIMCHFKWYQFIAPLVAMGLCFAAMFGLLEYINKQKGLSNFNKSTLGTLGLIAVILAEVIGGLTALTVISAGEWGTILVAAVSIALVIGALAGILKAVDKFSDSGTKLIAIAGALTLFALSIPIIAHGLSFLTDVKWEALWNAVGAVTALVVVLSVIAGVFIAVAKGAPEIAAILVLVVVALDFLAGAVALVGYGVKMMGQGMYYAADAVVTMTEAFKELQNINMKPIVQAFAAMVNPLLKMALAGLGLPLTAIGIAVIAKSLNPLAEGITNVNTALTKIDYKVIYDRMCILAEGLSVIAQRGLMLIPAAAGVYLLGNGFLAFATGVKLSAQGISMLIEILEKIQNIDFVTVGNTFTAISDTIDQVSDGIGMLSFELLGFGVASGVAGIGFSVLSLGFNAISSSLPSLANALTTFQNANLDLTAIGQEMMSLSSGVAMLGASGLLLYIAAPGFGIAALALFAMSKVLGGLQGIEFTTIGDGLSYVNQNGLLAAISGASMLIGAVGCLAYGSALSILGAAALTAAEGLTVAMHYIDLILAGGFEQAGGYACAGMTIGIANGIDKVAKAGQLIGMAAFTGTTEALDIHSPSKKFEWIGKNAGLGFIGGIMDMVPSVESTMSYLGKAASDAFGKYFDLSNFDLKNIPIIKDIYGLFGSSNMTGHNGMPSMIEQQMYGTKNYGWEKVKEMFGLDDAKADLVDLANEVTGNLPSVDELTGGLGNLASSATEVKSAFQTMTETISGQMDIFSEFNSQTEITGEQMLNNMKSQVIGVRDWANNIQQLAIRGIDQGLLAKLSELGPQGYEKVAAFVQMTDEQLAEANVWYAKSLEMPTEAAANVLQSYSVAGQMASDGFTLGLNPDVGGEAAYEYGMAVLMSLQDCLEIHSPSRKTLEMGEFMVDGMKNGLQSETEMRMLLLAANMMATRVMDTISASVSYSAGYNLGKSLSEGMANGISSAATGPTTTIANMANSVYNTAANKLQVSSPSKLFEGLGKYTVAGFVNGLYMCSDAITQAGNNMADEAINGFNNAKSKISKVLNLDEDFNPVIKPEMDLSNIQNGFSRINDMASKRLAVQTAASFNDYKQSTRSNNENNTNNGNKVPDSGNTYQFTQNNYSPKALSRTDIYRQTKNQFAAMKGMVEKK
jgi:tape measure domain-containing protein